jgi:hypothetical protein
MRRSMATLAMYGSSSNGFHVSAVFLPYFSSCIFGFMYLRFLLPVPTKIEAGNEEYHHLECNIVEYGRISSVIRRNVLLQISELKIETSKHPVSELLPDYTASYPKK